MRWLAWYFPHLPLELFGAREGQEEAPLAVTREMRGRVLIDRCNPAARRGGIRAGMALPAALALLPGLRVQPRDRGRERRALELLGSWAWRYSSRVSFDPLLVLLEVAGSLRLFGGFERLRSGMEAELVRLGHQGQWAAAPTPSAAALLARVAPGSCVKRPQELEAAVGGISLARFTRNRELLTLMRRIGLESIGDCLRLPRPELARRVGQEPALLLDRLLGRAPDPRPLWQPPERFGQRLLLLAEIDQAPALLFPARRLLESLHAFLRARDAATQRLAWRLFHREGEVTAFEIGLRAPAREVEHLLDVLRQRLERLELPSPVVELELRVARWQPWEAEKADFFRRSSGVEDPGLLERLQARLGEEAVQGLALFPDHRPERTWRARPPDAAPSETTLHPAQARQPLWLLPRPRPLPLRRGRPFHQGPLTLQPFGQRIQSGWWDDGEVDRDYYQAVNPAGERYWIYRDRENGGWFLHGYFD